MDIRKLRYFVVVAEELNFRRAADRLAISQPPLSAAIKQLEEEAGSALFERNTKMVALTAAGAAFYPEALKVLAQLEVARMVAQRVATGEQGVLHLGFVGGMLMRGMPEAIEAFTDRYPGVGIMLRELNSSRQLDAVRTGLLAGGFAHLGQIPPELSALPICDEPFACCVPAGHGLSERGTMDVAELRGERMVMFSREVSPAYYDTVVGMCITAGFSPDIRHEVSQWMTAVALVSKGMGVALVPGSFAHFGLNDVRFIRLEDEATRSIAHFVWQTRNTNPALQSFVDFLRKGVAEGLGQWLASLQG